jgi:DNA-binding transcriptional ArsR family regulator
MTPWSVDVQVLKNGRIHKAVVELRRDGNLVHQDKRDVQVAKERQALAKKLAQLTEGALSAEEFDQTILAGWDERQRELLAKEAAARAQAEAEGKAATADDDPEAESVRRLAETPEDIRQEAEALLRDPDLIDRITQDVELLGVAGEKELTATLYLVYTSRKLRKPLAARVRGPSSSGKSYLIDKSSSLMPPESVITATQISPQALFYMKKGSLRHKLVAAGERSRSQEDEVAEATRALREMLSSGRLSKLLPVKTGDQMESVLIEQEGPIAFVESTTLGDVFDEDENRALPLYTDERPEQTERIVTALAAGYAGPTPGGRDPQRTRLVHHAAQRLLGRREVLVPFAPQVGALLPKARVEVRRAFPFIMSMVQASALLHQFQRARTEDDLVIAERADYLVAVSLLSGAMRRLLGGGISEPAGRFAKRLREKAGTDTFTVQQAAKKDANSSKRSVYGWISELREAGIVERVTESAGRNAATYRLTDLDPEQAAAFTLPSCEEVFG